MERKSSVKEVYKTIKPDLPELYKTLCNKLGEDNPFAKASLGAGYYVWTDNRYQWHPLSEASSLKQEDISSALFELKNNIAKILGEKTTEALFTTPDDSYIYYNDDSGKTRILITGWGFKKPIRVDGDKETITIKKTNPISLSFLYDGERLPQYEFGIRLTKQLKRFSTENDGFKKFSNLKVGEHFTLVDLNKGNDLKLSIIEGKSQYDFDVTAYSTINVYVSENGLPLQSEDISLSYHNKDYQLKTDSTGNAKIEVAYHEGEIVSASVRDQNKQQAIDVAGNHISFSFESPVEEPPSQPKNTDISISVLYNNQGVPNQKVVITYGDNTYEDLTDENGIFIQNVEFQENANCEVSVIGYEPQSKLLEPENENIFVFDKNEQPKEEEKEEEEETPFAPYIVVKRKDGSVVPDYSINITKPNDHQVAMSDDAGIIQVTDVFPGDNITVTDTNHPENSCSYLLDANQKEYVFFIEEDNEEEDVTPLIKLIFRDVNDKAISCEEVNLHQDGVEDINSPLDEDGVTYIESDHFKTGVPVEITFKGWKDEYKPVPFTIDKDEYEYLIQEKAPKTSWKRRMLEILLGVLTAILCFILWPLIEAIVTGFANEIYN